MSAKPSLASLNAQLKGTKIPDSKTAPKAILGQKKRTKQKANEKKQEDKNKTPRSTIDNIPRGERSNFLKITITLPAELLSGLRSLGMNRKARGERDTDVSSLLREAAAILLETSK